MKGRKVINHKQLPTRVPQVIWSGMVIGLILDRVKAPEWVWAAFGTLWVILLVAHVVASLDEYEAWVKFEGE